MTMKKMITMIVLLHIASGDAKANELELVGQVQQALRQVEQTIPKQIRKLGAFTEEFSYPSDWESSQNPASLQALFVENWSRSIEFTQLQKMVSENWKEILDVVVEIAGDSEVHQIILYASFFYLPQEDFFECLNKIADLCLDNAMPTWAFNWAFDSYELHTSPSHRITYNYDNPVVIKILQKAKIIRPGTSEMYDRMLSGETKKDMINFLNNQQAIEETFKSTTYKMQNENNKTSPVVPQSENDIDGNLQSGEDNTVSMKIESLCDIAASYHLASRAWLWLLALPVVAGVWLAVRLRRK